MNFIQTVFPFAKEETKEMNEISTPGLIVPAGAMLEDGQLNDNQAECLEGDIEEYDDSEDTSVVSIESESEDDSVLENVDISGDCWCNKDLIPVDKITCKFPEKLLNKIKNIESCVNKKLHGSNEFSIFIHGDFDNNGNLVVAEDFYIPKQNVSGASVDYLEEPDAYYNGCLHKHPDGCKNFSGTDRKYINSNFEFSLLYVCKEVRLGIMNLKYFKNRRIQVPVQIVIDDGVPYEDVDITNICKETFKQKSFCDPNATGVPTVPCTKFPTFSAQTIKRKEDELILPSLFAPHNAEDVVKPEAILGCNAVDDLVEADGTVDIDYPFD